MTDKFQEQIASKLQLLRDDYAARLPAQLAELKQLALDLSQAERCEIALVALHQRLHKLAGSAGSFGFPDLGRQARLLEQQAQTWLAWGQFDPNILQAFSTSVVALADCDFQVAPVESTRVAARDQAERDTQIFLLEDDADLAEELSLTLSHFGHKVTHFVTLESAEKALAKSLPDILIVDIIFTEEERESPPTIAALQARLEAPIPVIFISSRSDFDSYLSAVRAGALGYFVKPLDIPRLIERMEYYLEGGRAAPYRVLIVDDDESLAAHYQLVLSAAGMRVEVLSHASNVLRELQDFMPEMILLDLHMPGCTGPELARVIRLNDEWLRVPIAYLSSESDADTRIKAMGQAGDDFLSKPISDRELVAAVTVRAARSRQLSEAIDRDSLTGLLKHSRIKEQVSSELSRASRSSEPLCVVMIDLDNFKVVNDTYGHGAGDKVIKALAQLLRQRLRKTDSIGRYGGEEFVAVLPGCHLEAAERLINDVREAFKSLTFKAENQSFQVTLSAGVALVTNPDSRPDRVLQVADDALYAAKRGGRDRVCSGRTG